MGIANHETFYFGIEESINSISHNDLEKLRSVGLIFVNIVDQNLKNNFS